MTLATFNDWFTTTWDILAGAALSAAAIYLLVIIHARIVGVRSFAKMSGFDFAMTIAVGSVIGATALNRSVSVWTGLVVVAVLFGLQWLIAKLRVAAPFWSDVFDNEPILVMAEGEILEDNLKKAAITRDDLMAKLREANCTQLSHARAVIVETTGDVSVLHGHPDEPIDEAVFAGVRDRGQMPDAALAASD